jgi:tetratricopeptide (TPR) repeat protein
MGGRIYAFKYTDKYTDRGSYRRAIYYLDRLIEKCPNVREYLTLRGACFLELEEGEAALADFDRSLEFVDRKDICL